MTFDPGNAIVKLCLQGMELEGKSRTEEAADIFFRAWNEATADFEKFIAAHYVSRHQKTVTDRLKWTETALQFALKIQDDSVRSAFPPMYSALSGCYEELGDHDAAVKYNNLAASFSEQPSCSGPFYHGTKADLKVGDFLTPGGKSNYEKDLIMNHIYFTALVNGAGLAAAMAKGDGRERIYIVEPTGSFEDDPNVTNKKFPGNMTQSYRTGKPLKIVGEVNTWSGQTAEDLQKWREKLANNNGRIIN